MSTVEATINDLLKRDVDDIARAAYSLPATKKFPVIRQAVSDIEGVGDQGRRVRLLRLIQSAVASVADEQLPPVLAEAAAHVFCPIVKSTARSLEERRAALQILALIRKKARHLSSSVENSISASVDVAAQQSDVILRDFASNGFRSFKRIK